MRNRNTPKHPGELSPAEKAQRAHQAIYNTLETALGAVMLSATLVLLIAMYLVLN